MEFSTELIASVATLCKQAGNQSLGQGLSALEVPYPEPQVDCSCGQRADYQFRRTAKTRTVFDWVEYRRAYYLCSYCHQGQYPLDQRLGLEPGQVSAGLAPLLALAGVETAFAEGCQLIERFLLLAVSDNTLRKETQTFGRLQAQSEQDGQAQSQDPAYLQERQRTQPAHPTRLYGSIDGAHVQIGDEWRELKTGSWYEVEKVRSACHAGVGQLDELRARNIRYYCDIAEAETFGQLLWSTGVQGGADLADEIVFVADGATWIWNLVERNFPRAVQIVDWYHAVEYLSPIAEVVYGANSSNRPDCSFRFG